MLIFSAMSDIALIPTDVPSISPSQLHPVLHEYWKRIREGSGIRELLAKSAVDLTLIIGPSVEDTQNFMALKY